MIKRIMERYKRYEPNQFMWIEYRAEELFPKGSYEEFLVNTINGMDVKSFWVDEDQGGEAPYDPRGMLGVIFYGISLGIFTSRKLEAGCQNHLGFMYVSGHSRPDHTTICRFIKDHFESMIKVFGRILYVAHEQGYLDYREIATDGTKIKANAAKRFSGTVGDFEKRKGKIEEKIRQALEKLRETQDEEESDYWKRKKERYEENKRKVEDFLKTAQPEYSDSGRERLQNMTDPDSRMMKLGKEYKQGYNAQISVCGKHGLIVATEVVNDENDRKMLPEMIAAVEKNRPEGTDAKTKTKHLADNGYVSPQGMEYVKEREIDAYIPMSGDKHAYRDEAGLPGRVRIEECRVQEEGNKIILTCPGGRTFQRAREAGKGVYTFTAGTVNNCEGCEHFKRCRGHLKGSDKKFEVTEQYLKIADFMETYRAKMKTDEARRIYSRRMDIVEKVFGHIKEDLGFRKMLRRSLPRVKCEWLFMVIAYNIKKLFTVNVEQRKTAASTA
jgi:transposase